MNIPDIQKRIDEAFLTPTKGQIYRLVIDDTEKILIQKALERTGGNQIFAARILGVNRNTLRSKIKKLNIDLTRFKNE